MIYLDHNSTTNIHPDVRNMIFELTKFPFNASSIHHNGRKAKNIIENSRLQLKNLLGIDSKSQDYQVIFTSSGTEANNLIISNFKDADIFISAIEHVSIFSLKEHYPNIKIINVNEYGIINLEHLISLLKQSANNKKLVSVMLANNETGIIQPLKEIIDIAHKFGALVHSDMVQAIGKIDVNITDTNIDFATISGHKFGSSQGIAALITRNKYLLYPMIIGGGQERGQRSGSENIAAIAGIGLAAEIVIKELGVRQAKMCKLQARLEDNLENVEIIGRHAPRLPNTSLISNSTTDAMMQLIALDLKNIAVSSGAACSSGKVGISHVLKAMNICSKQAQSAIRISVSHNNEIQDIDEFIVAFNEIHQRK